MYSGPSLEQRFCQGLIEGLLAGDPTDDRDFTEYQTDPVRYAREILDFHPWSGCNGNPGQLEIFQDIGESVRLQLAGLPATKVFRVEAGHGVGKTSGAAVIVNWFFDSFAPSVTITTAPTDEQVKLLLWKDIKAFRRGRGLPGKVLPQEARMYRSEDWFAIGRTTSDAGGKGTARMQGQHVQYLLYVIDEAEGVADFVFGAIEGMMTGGTVVIVLMLANPQSRTSAFYKKGKEPGVGNYRLSVLDHPNVVAGSEVVPGATRREWATERILRWCDPVERHFEDEFTFAVAFPVGEHPPGTIFKPNAEFCFRVLGVPPADLTGRVFVSSGRYEAATKRSIPDDADAEFATIGVDVARFGADKGAVYGLHRKVARKARSIDKDDSFGYWNAVKDLAKEYAAAGARKLSVRFDGTGGYGGGPIDLVKADEDLKRIFSSGFSVHEVHFGGKAHAAETYADIATEMYAEAAETLRGICLRDVPGFLEEDLTERTFKFVNRSGIALKKLQDKEEFRTKHKRSPDDGDGFVLAVAPEFLFKLPEPEVREASVKTNPLAQPTTRNPSHLPLDLGAWVNRR